MNEPRIHIKNQNQIEGHETSKKKSQTLFVLFSRQWYFRGIIPYNVMHLSIWDWQDKHNKQSPSTIYSKESSI